MSDAVSPKAIEMELLHWDNQDVQLCNRMGQVLSKLIATSRQMDVLTGYFYFNGVPELAKALEDKSQTGKPFTLRILVGMEAQIGTRAFVREILECDPPPCLTEAQRKARYAKTLLAIFKTTPGSEKTNADARLYNRFVEMLKGGTLKLEIKQTKQRNHGKLYLFYPEGKDAPMTYVLGSSNFSKPGLQERHELNMHVEKDPGRAKALAELYNELWTAGSHEIIEVKLKTGSPDEDPPVVTPGLLEDNSPCNRPTPFEAYMALMKRYLGESVLDADLEKAFENALTAAHYHQLHYQLKGAAKAINILRHHGGVIIADAVGLGKSVTAALIATQAHPGGGVIIVPPTIVGEWQDEYLEKFKLNAPGRSWAVFSMTELAAAEEFCGRNSVGMVIVDEAHRFRNPKIKDYAVLKRLCDKRKVALLTATPFNNVPLDLASLVDLFDARAERLHENASVTVYDYIVEQDRRFKDLVFLQRNWNRTSRPSTVEELFNVLKKKYAALHFQGKRDISQALKQMGDDLLEKLRPYVIRRNRSDLKHNPDYYQDGKPILMPEPKVSGKYYSLSPEQMTSYLDVLKVFQYSADANYEPDKGFACTIYRVGEFVAVGEDVGNYLDNYRSMTLRHLLRRFESSPYAFKRSLEDLISRHKEALADLNNPGKLCFNPKGLDLGEDYEDDAGGGANDRGGTVYCRPGAAAKGLFFKDKQDVAFIQGLESDLRVLNAMLQHADVLMKDDSKLALLRETIRPAVIQNKGQRDPLLKPGEEPPCLVDLPEGAPRRVVIFTMFIDTARHLAQELSRTYGAGAVMLAIDKPSGEQAPLDLNQVRIVHSAEEVTPCFDVKADNTNVWTAPRILITTDKFSEGVNLNRAGILVNYDIPWNPVRVIQRIGRINRINACWFKKIFVYNLYPEYQRSGAGRRTQHDWATAQDVAAQKLILIHQLFFEDATILGDRQAGGEKPFEALDKASERDSEPESEETTVQKRYQAALAKLGHTSEQTKAFEKRLLDYGTGMKTVRLEAPQANMVIVKQQGAQIKAEVLDNLHTMDMDQRTVRITLIEALDRIASKPDDPCYPAPNRFPDAYEAIEQRMQMPPSKISGTVHARRGALLNDKALTTIDAWKKRAELQAFSGALIRLYDACESRGLTADLVKQIRKVAPSASRDQIEAILKTASLDTDATATRTQLGVEAAPEETILIFANESKESELCPRQTK